jgi:hypothetical protein
VRSSASTASRRCASAAAHAATVCPSTSARYEGWPAVFICGGDDGCSSGECLPAARCPAQNRHRLVDDWQGGTVRAILENPRYTGYAIFSRGTKHETLFDPDDVAAGHVTRFRRSSGPNRPFPEAAHPAIVSVDDFTPALVLHRSKSAGRTRDGPKGRARWMLTA